MNPYYGAYPPQGLPQGVNGLGGWQNSQPMGYPGLGNQNGYQQIMQNDNANYRALHDEMVANRMADKDETIAQLRTQLSQMSLAASQQAQNNYLVSQLRPAPNPAYIVQNPNAAVGCNGLTGCCNMAS